MKIWLNKKTFEGLHHHTPLIILFLGQISAGLGTGIFDIALIWYALDQAENIQLVGGLIFFRFLPYILFGLLGGWLGDHWSRKKIIIYADLFRALTLCLGIYFIYIFDEIIILLALLSFLLTLARTFFQPAIQGILPTLCHKDFIVQANAIHHGLKEALTIIAPPIGGLLLTFMSLSSILFIIAALYLFAALITFKIPTAPPPHKERHNILSDYKVLISLLKTKYRAIAYLILMSVLAIFSVAGSLSLLIPAYIKDIAPNEPTMLGLLMTSIAIGTLSAVPFVKKTTQYMSEPKAMYVGWIIYGLLTASIAFSNYMIILVLIGFFLGVAGAFVDILLAVIIQKNIPENHISKTFALFSTLANTGEALSAPTLALIILSGGISLAFYVSGLFAVFAAFIGLFILSSKNQLHSSKTPANAD